MKALDTGQIGRYRVLAELGRGGMGRVLLGSGPDGRLVALKMVHEQFMDDEAFRARFRREVRASRKVAGAYTAAVIDADTEAPEPWLASVYVPGPSLRDAVRDTGALTAEPALRLTAGLAAALIEIHRAGLVHRDLKPSNVLLTADGPRVIDFGIARAIESDDGSHVTRTGALVGTPGFMSPEQALGRPLTSSSDVFSLGSVVVYACTGRAPFQGPNTPRTLHNVIHADPVLGTLPDRLHDVVTACLAKDPDARPSPERLLETIGDVAPAVRPWPAPVHDLITRQDTEVARLLHTASPPDDTPTTIDPHPQPDTPAPNGTPTPGLSPAHNSAPRTDFNTGDTPNAVAEADGAPAAGTGADGGARAATGPRTGGRAGVGIEVGPAAGAGTGVGAGASGGAGKTAPAAPGVNGGESGAGPDRRRVLLMAGAGAVLGLAAISGAAAWALRDDDERAAGGAGGTSGGAAKAARPVATLSGHTGTVYHAEFSPDGRLLVTAGEDGTVRLWDVLAGEASGEPLKVGEETVHKATFNNVGEVLATAGLDSAVTMWDVKTRRQIGGTLGVPMYDFTDRSGPVSDVTFAPDGDTLAAAGTTRVQIWDADSRERTAALLFDGSNLMTQVAYSGDGRLLAVPDRQLVRLWDVGTRKPVGDSLLGHTARISEMAMSPDGRTLATGAMDMTVRLWDVQRAEPIGGPLRGHSHAVQGLAFSTDGRFLASAGADGIALLWDVQGRKPVGKPINPGTGDLAGVGFSPDGRLLATAGKDGVVRLWDIADRTSA